MLLHAPEHEAQRRRRRSQAVIRRRRMRFVTLLAFLLITTSSFATLALARRSTVQIAPKDQLVSATVDGPVRASGETRPFFARLRGQNLSLPVAAREATIIAYQPATDERAVPLQPIGSQVNGGVVSRSIRRVFSNDSSVRYYTLQGSGRVVASTGSVDVGAPTGAVITAPVSGEVTGVKRYRLLGKYDDVQIDIRPAKVSGVTISMLFVAEPAVTIGQSVVAGQTQIGKVREVQGDLGAKLRPYTHDSGSHVCIQVTQDPTD